MSDRLLIPLRDGTKTIDPRLDRLKEFDERSRNFAFKRSLPDRRQAGELEVERRNWPCDVFLDQGREGACVGFGVSHELGARPTVVRGLSDAFAFRLYEDAKRIDPWPGEDYEGTSVLAGVKVAHQRGYMDSYRWCFSMDEILRALAYEGPVVVGTDWYDGMYSPRSSGLCRVRGEIVGGHCYLIRGFDLAKQLPGMERPQPMLRIRNSWGLDWGRDGDAWITIRDYEQFLLPGGEAVVFIGRKQSVPVTQVQIAPGGGTKRGGPQRGDRLPIAEPEDELTLDAEQRERQPVEV